MAIGIAAWLCVATMGAAPVGEPLLRDGDRVVLVGDTLIERAQSYGYLETALTSRHPGQDIRFRNVGWSADTTTGLSRTYFDAPAEGKRRLLEDIRSNKPTVLIFGYGMSESFAGQGGLPIFRQNYNQLLDETTAGVRRVILLSPIQQEQPSAALPDPQPRNQQLTHYSAAIGEIAGSREATYLDLFTAFSPPNKPVDLTDNGIHLTQAGYWFWALEVQRLLGMQPASVEVQLTHRGDVVQATGAAVTDNRQSGDALQFTLQNQHLPTPIPQELPDQLLQHPSVSAIVLRVTGLPEGKYALRSGDRQLHVAGKQAWEKGVRLNTTPLHQQADELREEIVRKNLLYFQKYRPQNITYLLGFRRYEQGQNAEEIEQLDKFIEQAEQKIFELSQPRPVQMELVPHS